MLCTFRNALKRALVHEGGYSNHPSDPGGVTLEGVTQRVYDAYCRRKGIQQNQLRREMRGTPEWVYVRDEIYREQYWDVIRGDQLPPGINYVVFDGAVNSGPVQSVKWLQRALGVRLIDGHIGTLTMDAIDVHPDHDALVRDICDQRMKFLKALKTWKAFGRGWASRVKDVEEGGNAWASGSIPAPATFIGGANCKALPSSAKTPPSTATPDAMAGGGTLTMVTSQVSTATEAIAPHAYTSDLLQTIFLILTLVGMLLTVIGVGWSLYNRWKRRELAEALDLTTTFDAETQVYA